MPELPEVETVRRRLQACLPGLLLRRVVVHDWTVSAQTEEELNGYLAGRRVARLRRRGKYLLVDLEAGPAAGDGPAVAVVHLRMTGQLVFRLEPGGRPPRFTWELEPDAALHFLDVRRFGRLWALDPEDEDGFFAARRMGPEPFGPEFTVAYLRGALAGRRAPLKNFLLDQRRVAGVGNIYADEALFRAGIHPLRPARQLTPAQCELLATGIREALTAGLDAGGATIDDFRHVDGVYGGFQHEFLVHRRRGEPCPVCGREIVKFVGAGRGTYACETCQPKPRRSR